jgi:tight adherence protein C
MILIGILLLLSAVAMLFFGLRRGQADVMSARLANVSRGRPYGGYQTAPEAEIMEMDAGFLLGATVQRVMPSRWIASIEANLARAGQPTTTSGFLIGSIACLAVLLALGFLLMSSLGGLFGLLGLPLCFLMGVFMPRVWLSNRVRYRQVQILKSLPDAFDLITVCVEAGLGLEAALARVAEKVAGPFGEELTIMLREVSMGKLRRDSLKDTAERIGVEDLTTFINAVIQAENMGTSIATVLRVQAEQMRMKRRQRAEQQAQAAPIKMMFPLVLCIFPTLFIVILGPAGMIALDGLSSK